MYSRYFRARIDALKKKNKVVTRAVKEKPVKDDLEAEVTSRQVNSASKTVYAYVGKKLAGYYDSITLCANALGMTRPMVKKAIENGTVLENGFILTFNKK